MPQDKNISINTNRTPSDELTNEQINELVMSIAEEYASGGYTFGLAAAKFGYTEGDLMRWSAEDVKPFFRRRTLKMAMYQHDQRFMSKVMETARASLLMNIDDRMVEETERVTQLKKGYYINENGEVCNVKGEVVERPDGYIIKEVTKTKHIKADARLIQFSLMNADALNFKDRSKESEQKRKQLKIEFGKK
ncbi:MAG: hypothetical protein ACPGXZ_00815 [Saprospiraceae bacterium]